jgi:anti-sigma regulatory factor (Ser/Thr protein kinase)
VAEAKGLRFSVRDSDGFAHGDPESLARILSNLVENAVRYTERGGVVVGCRRRGDALWLQVWDTGPGIPDDRRADVFLEFFQIDNPQRDRRNGLGLGLAIVDRRVRLVGGQLRLQSAEGRGSVFSVEVPAGRADAHQPAPTRNALQAELSFAGELIAVIGRCRSMITRSGSPLRWIRRSPSSALAACAIRAVGSMRSSTPAGRGRHLRRSRTAACAGLCATAEADGLRAEQQAIASQLFLTEKTVKAHLTRVFKVLAVVNRTQAVLEAQRLGLVAKSEGS